eukprot:gnl/Trimastix_PCT/1102.p2 GENE.gnl/Trimastix_PCT/1102~~gnl/Trimastix_PCT/1102.p2  ORF type:complete len:145 (+),score=19.53 gnl/Trimastix_PCT/1102:29-463(+)
MEPTPSASAAPVGAPADLQEALRAQTEWSRAVIFDTEGNVLASTFAADQGELREMVGKFNDCDSTFGSGLTLLGSHYDVHRFYERMIYGRRGDAAEGEGICLQMVQTTGSNRALYALITYGFPILSAKAVPDLLNFMDTHVAPM